MKIAIYKNGGSLDGYELVGKAETFESVRDYIRLTEIIDAEFIPLRTREVVEQQLAAIDRTESALREKFQSALHGIERQRAELMALPNLEAAK